MNLPETFYAESPEAQLLESVSGEIKEKTIQLPVSDIRPDEALNHLRDFAANHEIIKDPDTGKQFEILIYGRDTLRDERADVTVELASYSSAAAFPASNSLESIAAWLALDKTLEAPQARVYVSSPSMGGSDGFDRRDAMTVFRTGHATTGDLTNPEPLPYFSALARALESRDIRPTHATANSAGGFYLPALLCALPQDSIKSALFLDRAGGASSFAYLELGRRMLRDESKHMGKYIAQSDDPLCITSELQERCNDAIDRQTLLNEGSLRVRDGGFRTIGQKLLELNAYRKGADRHEGPITDITLAAAHQSDSHFNFLIPIHSALLRKADDIGHFLLKLVDGGIDEKRLSVITINGTHATKPGRPNTINGVELFTRLS